MLVPMLQLPPGMGSVVSGMMHMIKTMTMLSATAGGMTAIFKTMQSLIFSPTGILLGIGLAAAAISALSDETKDETQSTKDLNTELDRQKQLRDDILNLRRDLGQISSTEYKAELVASLQLLQIELERLDILERIAQQRQVAGPDISPGAIIEGTRRFVTAPAVGTAVAISTVSDKEVSNQSKILEIKKKILEITKQIEGGIEDDKKPLPGLMNTEEFERDMDRRMRRMDRDIEKSFRKDRKESEDYAESFAALIQSNVGSTVSSFSRLIAESLTGGGDDPTTKRLNEIQAEKTRKDLKKQLDKREINYEEYTLRIRQLDEQMAQQSQNTFQRIGSAFTSLVDMMIQQIAQLAAEWLALQVLMNLPLGPISAGAEIAYAAKFGGRTVATGGRRTPEVISSTPSGRSGTGGGVNEIVRAINGLRLYVDNRSLYVASQRGRTSYAKTALGINSRS